MTLSRAIQQKLDLTLGQWEHWQCKTPLQRAPNILRVLDPGFSNVSILVESGQQFVVRIDGTNPATHGLNRASEWRTLQSAHIAGLAPKPCYFNPDLGSLVCDYLVPDDNPAENFEQAGRLLAAIHRLPARHHRLDLGERIGRYEKQVAQKDFAVDERMRGCHDKIVALLAQLDKQSDQHALCHNDLLRANRILSNGSLWAIDWEYSAMGSPWFDLAVVICGDELDPADTQRLLHSYLGRPPDTMESNILHEYSCIYRYLELLWYLALEQPVLSPEQIEEKQANMVKVLQR